VTIFTVSISDHADPERADPERADPERADPERADPERADPERADPLRADSGPTDPERGGRAPERVPRPLAERRNGCPL
jgi:hypothetical protein